MIDASLSILLASPAARRLWRRLLARNSARLLASPRLKGNRLALVLPVVETDSAGRVLRWGGAALALDALGCVRTGFVAPDGTDRLRLPAVARLVPGEPRQLALLQLGRSEWHHSRAGAGSRGTIDQARLPVTPRRGGPHPVTLADWREVSALAEDLDDYAACRARAIARAVMTVLDIAPADRHSTEARLLLAAREALEARLWPACEGFWAALDADVLALVAWDPAPLWLRYNHIRRYLANDRQGRRRQALAVYPLLAQPLIERPELVRAVDDGRPLNPVLATSLNCRESSLRSLNGVEGPPMPVEALLTALDACPRTWHPRRPEDWTAFRQLLDTLRGDWPNGATRLRELGRDWQMAAKVFSPQAARDILDVARGLRGDLLRPILPRDPVAEAERRRNAALSAMVERLLLARPLRRQLEISRRWHALLPRLRLVTGARAAAPSTWPPLTPPFLAANGCRVVGLASAWDLAVEASEMHHCIDTYIRSCLLGEVHVVSVRDPAGRRLSTATLRTGTFAVAQHRGPRNTAPPPPAVAALDTYAEALVSGRLAVDHGRLAQAAAEAFTALRQAAPSAPADLERWPAVFALYRPLLPEPWRRMTADDFRAAVAAEL